MLRTRGTLRFLLEAVFNHLAESSGDGGSAEILHLEHVGGSFQGSGSSGLLGRSGARTIAQRPLVQRK